MSRKKPKKELIDLYLRFRWLLGGLNDLPSAELLRVPATEALLAEIVHAWRQGESRPINVLLAHEGLGHPNTIRRRIDQLQSAGFIEFQGDEADSRIKRVIPTEQALRHLARYAAVIRETSK
jgi:hypothetical protein